MADPTPTTETKGGFESVDDGDGPDEDDYEDGPQRDRLKTLIANSETDQKIYKAGFLNKTGGGRKGLKRWKRRYFLLSETALAYFTENNTRATTTLKGGMLLTSIEDVRNSEGAESIRPYIFVVVTPTRHYTIQAPTETQRTEWIEAIKQACDKLRLKRSSSIDLPHFNEPTPIKITYFPIRGRPERLRLLLADVGLEFENVVPKDWPTLKAELLAEGLQGTLPLIEFPDGTRVTQSVAAIRHFARLYKRYGSTEADATRCDVVADTVEDWRQDFDRVAYNPGRLDPTAVRTYAQEVLPMRLKLFERMLSIRDMEYVAGSASATFADFMTFDCLDVHLEIDSTVLDGYPRLRDFVALIRGRPPIAKYIATRPPSEFVGKEMSLSPDVGAVSM